MKVSVIDMRAPMSALAVLTPDHWGNGICTPRTESPRVCGGWRQNAEVNITADSHKTSPARTGQRKHRLEAQPALLHVEYRYCICLPHRAHAGATGPSISRRPRRPSKIIDAPAPSTGIELIAPREAGGCGERVYCGCFLGGFVFWQATDLSRRCPDGSLRA